MFMPSIIKESPRAPAYTQQRSSNNFNITVNFNDYSTRPQQPGLNLSNLESMKERFNIDQQKSNKAAEETPDPQPHQFTPAGTQPDDLKSFMKTIAEPLSNLLEYSEKQEVCATALLQNQPAGF